MQDDSSFPRCSENQSGGWHALRSSEGRDGEVAVFCETLDGRCAVNVQIGWAGTANRTNCSDREKVYDDLGRRTEDTQNLVNYTPDIVYESGYGVNGFRTSLAARIGTTKDFASTFAPDNQQRLASLVQQGQTGGNALAGKRLDFRYNLAGQFDGVSRYDGTNTTSLRDNSFYTYDDAGRLICLIHSTAAAAAASDAARQRE